MDYYCYFCASKSLYCAYCSFAPTQLYYVNYYVGYYSNWYSNYYARYATDVYQSRHRNTKDKYVSAPMEMHRATITDGDVEMVIPIQEKKHATLHFHRSMRPQDKA
jgi:predicted S18 family serine protease